MPEYATNPADLVKIFIFAWLGVFVLNHLIAATGKSQYTTKGQ